jgi:hypothetical protein
VAKRKKFNAKTRITSALRRIWLWSPMRREAIKRARDNGNKCEKCSKTDSKLQIDHIVPVVPLTGFDTWDGYIERLLVDSSGLRCWCEECHSGHTLVQRKQRMSHKKKIDKKLK